MRKVLFRGLTLETKRWVYGYLIELWTKEGQSQRFAIDPCAEYGDDGVSLDVVEVEPETVGQYTGRNDNHENKIFEGDLLKEIGQRNIFYKVVFDKTVAQFLADAGYTKDHGFLQADATMFSVFRVFGNIHQNPEFLKTT